MKANIGFEIYCDVCSAEMKITATRMYEGAQDVVFSVKACKACSKASPSSRDLLEATNNLRRCILSGDAMWKGMEEELTSLWGAADNMKEVIK